MKLSEHSHPVIVLTRPQMGENIGAAARVMMNFGIESLRLVAPRDGWPNERAVALSAHAVSVLDAATVHDSLTEAIADCHQVLAVTARPRDVDLPVYSAEEGIKRLAEAATHSLKTALVFGPENNGLETAEVAMCNGIITIATSPRNPSLNLAQAVGIACYEWSRAVGDGKAGAQGVNAAAPSHADYEALYQHFTRLMDEKQFYATEAMKPIVQKNLRAMLARSAMNAQDIRTMHGILRAIGNES
jgi:tRNA/rRNA methyltransferase